MKIRPRFLHIRCTDDGRTISSQGGVTVAYTESIRENEKKGFLVTVHLAKAMCRFPGENERGYYHRGDTFCRKRGAAIAEGRLKYNSPPPYTHVFSVDKLPSRREITAAVINFLETDLLEHPIRISSLPTMPNAKKRVLASTFDIDWGEDPTEGLICEC